MTALVLATGLGACVQLETRGFVPDEQMIERVTKGLPRTEVEVILGSPSSVATFGRPESWYYISRRVERRAFLDEKLLEQTIVEIQFDDRGRVSDIKRYAAADQRQVIPSERVTPSLGKELGILEQFFGNVGRFNKMEQGSFRDVQGLPR